MVGAWLLLLLLQLLVVLWLWVWLLLLWWWLVGFLLVGGVDAVLFELADCCAVDVCVQSGIDG